MNKRRKASPEKDLTASFLAGELEDEPLDPQERFSQRSARALQRRMRLTALLRAAENAPVAGDIDTLPLGQVTQVYSLYCEVEHEGRRWLCAVRKTLRALLDSPPVVGDLVRFRPLGEPDERERPEGVIEQVLSRTTVLTRADSFKGTDPQPIVANAQQMLIVAAVVEPPLRLGLVDRMIVAARSGGLRPVVCLNKIDILPTTPAAQAQLAEGRQALDYYAKLGLDTLATSATTGLGLERLREILRDRTTVLAGHSGVGKSSLIRALQPQLDIRIGHISHYTGKGTHTTTSARRYDLTFGGHVIDTPGVKLFGLWNVTRDSLLEHFPDVANGTAPLWRQASYQRILESLPQ